MYSYWWIVDYIVKPNGKVQPILLGNRAFSSEESAQNFKDSIETSQRCELLELPTRDPSRASQYIRGKLVKDTKSTSSAITRVRHKKVKEEPDYKKELRARLRR